MPVPFGEDAYTPLLYQQMQAIADIANKVIAEFNKLVGKVNDNRFKLAPVMWLIKDELNAVRDLLHKIMEKVDYALQHQIPVVSLISASFRWVNEVKTPISELSSQVNDHTSDLNFAQWSGGAATEFKYRAGLQKDAVDQAEGGAEFISSWLMKIAQANVDFAKSLAQIMTKIYAGVVQAVIEAGSLFDIPWAVSTCANIVGTLVGEGLNTLLEVGDRFVDALGNVRDLASQAGDHSVLSGGKWPQAVTQA